MNESKIARKDEKDEAYKSPCHYHSVARIIGN